MCDSCRQRHAEASHLPLIRLYNSQSQTMQIQLDTVDLLTAMAKVCRHDRYVQPKIIIIMFAFCRARYSMGRHGRWHSISWGDKWIIAVTDDRSQSDDLEPNSVTMKNGPSFHRRWLAIGNQVRRKTVNRDHPYHRRIYNVYSANVGRCRWHLGVICRHCTSPRQLNYH